MERWEHEIVEFKEVKGGYDTDKIGRYFSAISNEANLRNQQYGWLVFGVSEKDKVKHVVGTAYKKGDKSLLEKFKYEISRDTTNGMTFYDIIELLPVVNGKEINKLLWDKLPDSLSDDQKKHKVHNLLTALKNKNIIEKDGENQRKANWILKD